jgi:outer membrane receptor protein involved in Fe transport
MQSIGGMIQAGINLADWNELSAGFDYRHNKVDKTDTYFTVSRSGGIEGKQHNAAVFVQDDIKLFDDKLILNFGGRYDVIVSYDGANWDTNPKPLQPYSNEYSSKIWSEFSPKAGVVYHLFDKTTLRSSFGTGFKAPSLYELYTSLTRGKILIDANAELKPERAIAYDIGVEQQFLEGLCGTVTFYQSFAKDFIGYNMISKIYWKRENISEVDIHGVETELKYKINNGLSCFANYTYDISEIKKYSADLSVEGNYLPEVPKNKCAFGILYTNPKLFDFNLLFNYKGRTYADNENEDKMGDYATVDLRISKEFFKYFTLSLEVENLFDRSYVVAKGTDQDTIAPGRAITGVVNVKF